MFYDTARLKEARKLLEDSLRPFVPEAPLEGEVCLATGWFFPTKTHREKSYRVTRPDTDNLQKLLKDCMTRVGFWKDDALICSEIVEKYYSDEPGIMIWIYDSMSMDLPDEGWF
jgi:Holliday junction resolvase RusA-like endonuclease